MYRLEEMRAWQKEQQSKLLKLQEEEKERFKKLQENEQFDYGRLSGSGDHECSGEESANSEDEVENSESKEVLSLNPAISYDTEESRKNRIKYLEALLDECYHKKALLEEMPISSPVQDFNKLLELNLSLNKENVPFEKNEEEIQEVESKPKRPFLRKGEGLARFRMTPEDFKKPVKMNFYRSRSHSALKTNSPGNNLTNYNRQSSRIQKLAQPKSKFTTSNSNFKKPVLNLKPVQSAPSIKIAHDTRKTNPRPSILKKPLKSQNSGAPFHSAAPPVSFETDQKSKKEQRELRIFEILEEKVGDSSFCSTSSTIAKLMENSIKSTPLKEKEGNFVQKSQADSTHGDSENVKETCVKIKDYHRKAAHNDDTDIENDDDWSDMSTSEEGELIGSDQEKDKTGFTSDESQPMCSPPPNFQKNSHFNEDLIYQKQSMPYSISRKDFEDLGLKFQPESLISSKGSKPEPENQNPSNLQRAPSQSERFIDDGLKFKSDLLQQRLEDLEKEVEVFQKENAKLMKAKQEFETEKLAFQKQKREFEAKVRKFHEEDEAKLIEERKKLQKEKLVFDRYTKEVRNKPNKQEREEIKNLKNEISTLKQDLERKEGKWGTAQARLRNQLKVLEKDNANLRDEISNLKKESSRAQLISKGIKLTDSVSNTNVIHAINRQLSQLTPEDIEELLSKREQILKKPVIINKPQNTAKPKTKIVPTHKKTRSNEFNSNKTTISALKNKKKVQIDDKNVESISDSESSSEPESEVIFDSLNKPVYKSLYPEADDIVLKQYETEFFNKKVPLSSRQHSKSSIAEGNIIERVSNEGNREKIFPDGRKEIWFSNGNVKKISPDGNVIKIIYYNGDVKETNVVDNLVKYYYAESKTWHTTHPDGLEILEFSNGQVEKRLTNGVIEVSFPNGCSRTIFPDGREEWIFSDKSVLKTNKKEGCRILELPNGQKEIHTEEYKKREYPDGTTKIIYPDGTQETRYASGRIRLKDKHGKLLMDSGVK